LEDAQTALRESRSLGLQHAEALALHALALVHEAEGLGDEALGEVDESLCVAESLGMIRWETDALAARLLDAQNDTDHALRHGEGAVEEPRERRSSIRECREEDALLE